VRAAFAVLDEDNSGDFNVREFIKMLRGHKGASMTQENSGNALKFTKNRKDMKPLESLKYATYVSLFASLCHVHFI